MDTELDGPRLPARDGPPRQLVVICHGWGANGTDLIDLGRAWAPALPHAAFVAPDAPFPQDDNPSGRQWWSLADRAPALMQAGARRAAGLLDGFITAELARLGLPPDAYALAGFSQGAMLVLFAGLRRLPAPRAILAYAGLLVAPASLSAEKRNNAPVLLVHGEADGVVPPEHSRSAAVALRQAGVPVQAQYLPGLDHTIDAAAAAAGAMFLRDAWAP